MLWSSLSRDRLTRSCYEHSEYFFKQFCVKIENIFGEELKNVYQELVENLIAIMTSFARKLYGMRSRRKNKLTEGFKELLEEVEKNG